MAYVSHSPFDYRSLRARAGLVSPSLLIRSAFVAIAAAIAMLALSEVQAPAETVALAPLAHKADRLLAPIDGSASEIGRMIVDVAARTTTVERGMVAELSPASPMSPDAK